MKKEYLVTGAVALVAVMVVAFVQQKVMPIPVIGGYLPK